MSHSNKIIESLIKAFKELLTPSLFKTSEDALIKAANYATPAAAAVGLLIGVVGAIKMDSFKIFLLGAAWVFFVAIAYYVGSSFLDACQRTIKNSRTSISSQEFLKTSALLMIIGFFLLIGFGVYMAIVVSSTMPLKVAIPISVVLLYYACIFLNPDLISTEYQPEATAGEDALSIMMIFYKAAIRLAGIVFGSMVVIGSVMLVISFFELFSESGIQNLIYGGVGSMSGGALVISGLLFPFGIYVIFVFAYLIVDICKAILSLHKRN